MRLLTVTLRLRCFQLNGIQTRGCCAQNSPFINEYVSLKSGLTLDRSLPFQGIPFCSVFVFSLFFCKKKQRYKVFFLFSFFFFSLCIKKKAKVKKKKDWYSKRCLLFKGKERNKVAQKPNL